MTRYIRAVLVVTSNSSTVVRRKVWATERPAKDPPRVTILIGSFGDIGMAQSEFVGSRKLKGGCQIIRSRRQIVFRMWDVTEWVVLSASSQPGRN
jgi:hypothetical protein